MKKKLFITITITVIVAAAFLVILWPRENGNRKALVAHSGGPLIAVAYAAAQDQEWKQSYELRRLGTAADVSYALLSGTVDAGFVEVSKISALANLQGFEQLTAIGKITFPYGASVVLREGLNLRLSELNGQKIGISSAHCELLEAFQTDAERLGVDLLGTEYVVLPFIEMLPALEAGVLDAIVTKSAFAVLSKNQGHTILYQNWDVVPGDECCPAIVDQAQYVLLARRDAEKAVLQLAQSLMDIQEAYEPHDLRNAVARALSIRFAALDELPVATFSFADDSLIQILVVHAHPEGEIHLDHDADQDKER